MTHTAKAIVVAVAGAVGAAGLSLGASSASAQPDAGAADAGHHRKCEGLRGQAFLDCLRPPPIALDPPGHCQPRLRATCMIMAHRLDGGPPLPAFCADCLGEP